MYSSLFPQSLFVAAVIWQLLGRSNAGRAGVTAYDDFREVHRSGEAEGKVSYSERTALFKARHAEVQAHNAHGKSWTMTINRFSDYTQGELKAYLGYKRAGRSRWGQPSAEASSFVQTSPADAGWGSINVSALAKVVDWRSKMGGASFVHDQGSCGSCWAHAAVGAIEAHAKISAGLDAKLATQQIIDCTANPRHCGGTGGCQGATAEEAFEQARKGIDQLDQYTGTSGKCGQAGPSALRIQSFVRLPENKASYLMRALAEKGPVVLSIAAEQLFSYHGGVFSACQPDTVVNHAVLGVGYGNDEKSGKDYFTIRNSWGEGWGEKGYFRNERFNEDNKYCGTDNNPKEGVYCDDAPATIKVCGMCGITSDSAYPVIAPRTHLRQVETHSDQLANVEELVPVF